MLLLPIAYMVPNYFCIIAEARFVKDQSTNELLDEDQQQEYLYKMIVWNVAGISMTLFLNYLN